LIEWQSMIFFFLPEMPLSLWTLVDI
jgi:hypothetical protein